YPIFSKQISEEDHFALSEYVSITQWIISTTTIPRNHQVCHRGSMNKQCGSMLMGTGLGKPQIGPGVAVRKARLSPSPTPIGASIRQLWLQRRLHRQLQRRLKRRLQQRLIVAPKVASTVAPTVAPTTSIFT